MLRLMLLDFAPKIIHCYNAYFSNFLWSHSKQGGLKGIIAELCWLLHWFKCYSPESRTCHIVCHDTPSSEVQ